MFLFWFILNVLFLLGVNTGDTTQGTQHREHSSDMDEEEEVIRQTAPVTCNIYIYFFFFMHFFSGTKHPREDNPNLYYWAEMTGLHTQTCNI